MLRFEDLTAGDTFDCGRETVDRAEMVAFAERYDPQPFHVDERAARDSPFGGLVASGWYTAAVCMRRLVDGALTDLVTTGARGVDALRWHDPVRPGDTLAVEATVEERTPESENHGLVRLRVTGEKADESTECDDDPAISMVGLVLVARA